MITAKNCFGQAKKKVVLFPEIGNRRGKNILITHPPRIVECASDYLISISKNKQTSKRKKKEYKKNQKKLKKKRKSLRKID